MIQTLSLSFGHTSSARRDAKAASRLNPKGGDYRRTCPRLASATLGAWALTPPRSPPRALIHARDAEVHVTQTTYGNLRDERGDLPMVVPVGPERRGRAPTEGPPPVRRGRLDPDGPARVPGVGNDDAVHHSRTACYAGRTRGSRTCCGP